jgi:hypothetical protein
MTSLRNDRARFSGVCLKCKGVQQTWRVLDSGRRDEENKTDIRPSGRKRDTPSSRFSGPRRASASFPPLDWIPARRVPPSLHYLQRRRECKFRQALIPSRRALRRSHPKKRRAGCTQFREGDEETAVAIASSGRKRRGTHRRPGPVAAAPRRQGVRTAVAEAEGYHVPRIAPGWRRPRR